MNSIGCFVSATLTMKMKFPIAHEAIFQTLRTIGINETYITILEDIHTGAPEKVHIRIIMSQRKYRY